VNAHGASVGYLSQESQCRLGVTVGEEMRAALPGVADVEARLAAAAAAVGAGDASKSQLNALSEATDDLQRLEAHTLEARIGRVLAGLGFELDATDRLTDTYSGGWQMRIAMAKLLLSEPDYLFPGRTDQPPGRRRALLADVRLHPQLSGHDCYHFARARLPEPDRHPRP
jgi:ATP-binding cassette subfamily F protein 3